MDCTIDVRAGSRVALVHALDAPLADARDANDLIATVFYAQDCQKIVLPRTLLSPAFFQLRTGLAGEILQKFTNYRMALTIVGDFSREKSEPLQAFIHECNRGRQVCFAATQAQALDWLHGLNAR